MASSSSDRQSQLLKEESFRTGSFQHQLGQVFPENFRTKLQNNQLQKNTFQQLSLEYPSFTEKILNKELATTFAKNSLMVNLVFQTFFLATLALQKAEQLGENNLYKKHLAESSFTQTEEEARKEQLLTIGFPEASLNQQPFSNSLVQPSGAKAASQLALLHKELLDDQLADKNFDQNTLAATSLPTRTSRRQLQKDKLEEENFTENSFEALCLNSFPGTACTEALLPDQLLQQQLSTRNFHQDSFSASSLSGNSFRAATSQTAAFRRELSDRQLHRQQLDRNNLQHSSFEKNTFEKTSFKDKSLAEKSFAESSFAKPSFTKSSFAASSLADRSLEEHSFADDNFQEATFPEASFYEDSFAEKSLREETFHNYSLEKENFQKDNLPESSFH